MNKLIVANWKMSLSLKQTLDLSEQLTKIDNNQHTFVICPSILYLLEVQRIMKGSNIVVGAQDSANKNTAAFTGGVSAVQLAEVGCKYAIVGHSERRIFVHETGKEIHDKILHLIEQSITPILCIGEDSISHNAKKTNQVIAMQLDEVDFQIDWSKVIVAYEPLWAIGTGQTPTTNEILEVVEQIKLKVNPYKILYGGSVNQANIKELSSMNAIDGFLIGSASIKIDEMKAILSEG